MDLSSFFTDFAERDWQVATEGTVRFAMVGIGWWTREFAVPVTEDSEICETTAVVSSSAEKAADFADGFDDIEHALTYDEFHDGEAADAYDAVYVATPNALHLPHVEAAADLGKHVLCEKPMEASAERAERMIDVTDDVTLMIAYRMHTDPAVRRVRSLVRQGFLGEIVQVQGHMTQPLLEINPDHDQWRLNPDLAGPGATMTDIGVYPLNTARFVLNTDPKSVTAQLYSEGEAFTDVPDERAAFTARMDDGVLVSASVSHTGHERGSLRITGTEGDIRLEPAFNDATGVAISKGGVSGTFDVPDTDIYHQMYEEFDYFADCVLADRDPLADGEHGLVDVRTIEAVIDAGERGERVDL